MPTWYDVSTREPAEAWRALRRRRARPPVPHDSRPDRVETFQNALEQAEQQFRAAAAVGYDSRALNLYYGASQAGRALAAAAASLNDQNWRLRGHGLKCTNLTGFGGDVSALAMRAEGGEKTSFQRLSQILGSPIPKQVTLGEIWPSLFETTFHAPLGDIRYSPMETHRGNRMAIQEHGVDTATPSLPPAMLAIPSAERPALCEFLARYPALDGSSTRTPAATEVGWPPGDQALSLQWALTETEARSGHVLDARLTKYRGHWMAFPTIEGATAPMHPLMAWWVVLYALSMVTRYEPARWTRMIDVNSCQQAIAVEFVLDSALAVLPDILDEAIDVVAEHADASL